MLHKPNKRDMKREVNLLNKQLQLQATFGVPKNPITTNCPNNNTTNTHHEQTNFSSSFELVVQTTAWPH